MKELERIKLPILADLERYAALFDEVLTHEEEFMSQVLSYVRSRKGKMMRPMLVLLLAKELGAIGESTLRSAVTLELLHTSSLIHDDVVDESYRRRSFFSINALWGNKTAVLIGDYLLSKSVILSTENKDFDLLEIVSQTIKDMSEGELLQLEKARKLDITEDIYYQIIRQKTASLISACCQIGAVSNNAENSLIMKMKDFGIYAGMAFQIKDDLFDYFSKNIVGKPVGIDIKEQKMTLPLIYSLKTANEKDRKYYFNIIKNHNKNPKRVKELIDFVKKSGGLDYAEKIMENYQQKALDILSEFPDNEAKKSLQLMLDYVIKREF